MYTTLITKREKDCPYIYLQNNNDVTVNYLYNLPMPLSARFYGVECYVKKTGIKVSVEGRQNG